MPDVSQKVTSPKQSRFDSHGRRHQRYIDSVVQGRLLIGLIALELLVFSSSLIYIYQELTQIIHSQTYRIHVPIDESTPSLIMELLKIIPWIVGINVIAVLIVDRLWARHIHSIIVPLQHLISSVSKLDLREQIIPIDHHHEVLNKARDWISLERDRNQKIHGVTNALNDASDVPKIRLELNKLRELLA